MAFQPMLIIGCGGSGGATLQYMMDSVKTELSRQLEKAGAPQLAALPGAWQFVHIDVPSSPDGADTKERPPTVRDQGGVYVGLARPGLDWRMVATEVWGRTKAERPDLTAGWLRRPSQGDPPLEQGAGQERAVGRGVTLNSIGMLRDALSQAKGKMTGASGMNELRQLADVLGAKVADAPVVMVVSSMAGGSGASMVLDVPQVLAGLDRTLASTTAMFLYTSEVFGSLDSGQRRGVEANGLAMMGELLATSLGSNESDAALLRLLAVNGADTPQPFKRVFPIGRKHGLRGAIFGDGTLESVYRAVGRALAGMVASPVAMDQFLTYDLANRNPQPTDLSWLGEGSAEADPVLWGTFGYARLSLGRDRYGEYVSQRLARQAVDRLVAGHQRGDEDAGGEDLQRAVDDAYRRMLLGMGLPDMTNVSALSLLTRQPGHEDEALRQLRQDMKETVGRQVFGDGEFAGTLAGQAYARVLRRVLGRNKNAMDAEINDRAYSRVYQWHEKFMNDLLTQIDAIAAVSGLPVARQVVVRLKEDVGGWLLKLQTESAEPGKQSWVVDVPANVLDELNRATGISAAHPAQERLSRGLANQAANSAQGSLARLMIGVLEDFGPSFADPLADALAGQHRSLAEARKRDPRQGGQADLRTSAYAEWPRAHERVPQRFQGAHNELVLLDVQEFPRQYDDHILAMKRSRHGITTQQEAEDLMLSEILRDRWLEHNDTGSRSSVIATTAAWIPSVLISDPSDPARLRNRSSARFAVRMSAQDVVERARQWVWRQDGEFGPFLSIGLTDYMNPADPDFDNRLRRLVARFEETLTQALPLVSVESEAFGKVHKGALTVNYKFSAIPFEQSDAVRDALAAEITQTPGVSSETQTNYQAALTQGTSIDHIDVFAAYDPMSPLAFGSLLQPLVDAWREALAKGAGAFFWTNRRARPWPGSLAMSPSERRATIAGYVLAKLTGRLRGSYRVVPHQPSAPLEVFNEDLQQWLRFPSPLLTPYTDGFQVDELPSILESHLLAIAECGHQHDLSPLLPYRTLRHTFAEIVQSEQDSQARDKGNRSFNKTTGSSYLARWILDGWRPTGAPAPNATNDVNGQQTDLATAKGRKAAAVGFLSDYRQEYADYFHPEDPRLNPGLHPYDRRPMMAAIAPDVVWALEAVLDLVGDIELDAQQQSYHGPVLEM